MVFFVGEDLNRPTIKRVVGTFWLRVGVMDVWLGHRNSALLGYFLGSTCAHFFLQIERASFNIAAWYNMSRNRNNKLTKYGDGLK